MVQASFVCTYVSVFKERRISIFSLHRSSVWIDQNVFGGTSITGKEQSFSKRAEFLRRLVNDQGINKGITEKSKHY